MKVYLVWEHVDYSEYKVVKIFDSEMKGLVWISKYVNPEYWYRVEEKEVE